ncbi:unnamed protein product [Linum tenue]|uniref:Uncharacterized protein n=1 Tax=Linum tenue TaxID=586396 RepID=A0AAV0KEH5_9ROSI|nr:unnamed protein product [Linum tenue]CAI0378887.1 unnamed protein product [Linum tenue]CAI0378967.1 unnamed protein product [Linum tenue]CAI0380099.1 unnamed protein product [Linum tenue]CAI0380133.1 unnamed protein product [Linum tenue]
MEKGDPLFQL